MTEQTSSLLGSDSRARTPSNAYKNETPSASSADSHQDHVAMNPETSPSPLQRSLTRLLAGVLVDVMLGVAAALFLVLAILVRVHEHEPVENHRRLVSSLQEAMQYVRLLSLLCCVTRLKLTTLKGSTLFPIIFAAAVSRGLRSVMLWRLEQGARIGLLDTLAGSTTVFNTLATQINLRTPTILGAILVLVWGLSPVGSQASLRIMSTMQELSQQNLTIQYTDTAFWFLSFYDSENRVGLANALFTASLLSPAATKRSTMDTWGNVKIPIIEQLDQQNATNDGWITVPLNPAYSALSGLYISNLTESRNTSVTLEASYMIANCLTVRNSFPISMNVTFATGASARIYSPSDHIPPNGTGISGRNASAGLQPRVIYYDTGLALPERDTSYPYDHLSPAANCTLRTSYVEVEAACVGRNCSVARMRPSLLAHNTTAWTVLDRDRAWTYWSYNFVNSVAAHSASATAKEIYFVDPYSPGSPSTCGGYEAFALPDHGCSDAQIARAMDPRAFSVSLTQLMNTYWLANAGPDLITNGLGTASSQACQQFRPPPNPNVTCEFVVDAPATRTKSVEVIVCNNGWLVAIVVAAAVMIAATALRLIAALSRRFGDLLFNVTTLVRASSPAASLPAASTLEDVDMSRALRAYTARFGDLYPKRDVGRVGIGVLAEGTGVGRFRKGRLFE